MSADAIGLDKGVDPASSPTIKVEIYDQAYTVRSDGDPEYLKELAEYVDQRMREISSGTLTVDSRKVAIWPHSTSPMNCIHCARFMTKLTSNWRRAVLNAQRCSTVC